MLGMSSKPVDALDMGSLYAAKIGIKQCALSCEIQASRNDKVYVSPSQLANELSVPLSPLATMTVIPRRANLVSSFVRIIDHFISTNSCRPRLCLSGKLSAHRLLSSATTESTEQTCERNSSTQTIAARVTLATHNPGAE